jgi:Spherulation-specific family 4.
VTRVPVFSLIAWVTFAPSVLADDSPADKRRREAQEFHQRAQQRTGLLVPLYAYPANVHTNGTFNRLIDVKRRFETVPIWVILNPASGPGEKVDANYSKAIDRLQGAGCVTLGYVTTSYGKRPAADVERDVDRWLAMYPRIHGVFFDEMRYEDDDAAAAY